MRKKRELRDDAIYHVTARVNRQRMELGPWEVKELLCSIIERAIEKYPSVIKAYSIMDNHIHLLIAPDNGLLLPIVMRWMLGVFAMAYNRRFGLSGHFWHDRYRSKIIKSPMHFYRALLYIGDNPVRAGMVDCAVDFAFSHCAEIVTGHYRLMEKPGDKLLRFLKHYLCQDGSAQARRLRNDIGFFPQKTGRKAAKPLQC